MNRRGFLGMLVGGVAVAAAERAWPFRVYSFPAEPVVWPPLLPPALSTIWYDKKAIEALKENLTFSPLSALFYPEPWFEVIKHELS